MGIISSKDILNRYSEIFVSVADLTPFDRCAGLIAATIDLGVRDHDQIVRAVPKTDPAHSHRFVGFVLGQLAGDAAGLWRKDRHRRYYLH